MTIPGVNERMALLIKLLKDDPERLLMVKEVESRFSISNFTARSDLKALVQLGLLNVIQVNKKIKVLSGQIISRQF
ncbi:DeoR family transcriptional regulator [Sediminibacterium sp. C3]|uniref:DeoR family transcriptional regulator n=1 Tax=Sediminibacterium sp. C3 TaxID=1267211 RepID=UPI00047C8CDA|nr:DeoR family transcriptional regulator [Sediminibacterium sp. C3]